MNDLKFAVRQLLKNPGFTAVAVLTLCSASSARGQSPARTQLNQVRPTASEAAEPAANLRSLFAARQWFTLREALDSKKSPTFYRGAVAAAFNQADDAEKLLRSVIKAAPRSEQSEEAYELLAHLYLQTGQYGRLKTDLKRRRIEFPDRPDVRRDYAALGPLLALPNQTTTKIGHAVLRHDDGLFVPLSLNGRPATYFIDTGAGISAMSESEAKRLGMTILETAGEMGTSTSRQTQFHVAVAKQFMLGATQLKNVSFAIFRDDQEPWVHLAAGRRGLLGIPVLLAAQRLRWARHGTVEIGPGAARRGVRKANLCFDEDQLMAAVRFGRQDIPLRLDTGAVNTEFYGPFADQFQRLVAERGKKSSHELRGIGQVEVIESLTLPEINLVLGGLEVALRPVPVLLKQVGHKRCFGNIGMDLLKQAAAFEIDFRSMTLDLEGDRETGPTGAE